MGSQAIRLSTTRHCCCWWLRKISAEDSRAVSRLHQEQRRRRQEREGLSERVPSALRGVGWLRVPILQGTRKELMMRKSGYREITGVIHCLSGLRVGASDELLP